REFKALPPAHNCGFPRRFEIAFATPLAFNALYKALASGVDSEVLLFLFDDEDWQLRQSGSPILSIEN
ncbi:hypothetical protein, partial [Leptospira ellisii]|uniref:hypothetical protein n=1 Tax=Leptospira ellisii TaxID=2023197 RepID=UPI000CCB0EAA